ncbi:MAG: hypothetical protein EOP47_19070 [Sphingobacteriaceae bacterium]|nr:MAG: hypothetical protein EOP47_19070 [Sphingobacteriaceae bacterium]
MRFINYLFVALLLVISQVSSAQVKKDTVPEGQFAWQDFSKDKMDQWHDYSYSLERWWGEFPKDIKVPADMYKEYSWAVGPIKKYDDNPVMAPTPGAWDQGHFSGGVHNGSILIKDDTFYYVYRGERSIDIKLDTKIDYICDIGVATSKDGIHFTKDNTHQGFFRTGADRKYSYEDVNVAKYGDTYYLFCNQWYWPNVNNYKVNGTFLATSKDLINWTKIGIVFPNAKRTHRNAVVLQGPTNEAVKVNGKFVMYINGGLMAYSTDMVHWESKEISKEPEFPGGECSFALADYDKTNPDNIILFTGGAHTGHFYAVGEVLFSKKNPERHLAFLPGPALTANPKIPYEHGFEVNAPYKMISSFADCIFFNGLTQYKGKWWMYYGGSEYYTCLANAPVTHQAK